MKQAPLVILAVGVVALVVVGALVYQRLTPSTVPVSLMEDGIVTAAPQTVVDSATGQVNQDQFETQQALSSDSSLTTIQGELQQTVILEEDFSNL